MQPVAPLNARATARADLCVDVNRDAFNSIEKIHLDGQAEPLRSRIQVIFVESDEVYRRAVEAELVAEGFAVHAFDDGEPMLGAVASGLKVDIAVLDWDLESGASIDLLSRIRERDLQWPVVFLTARNNPVFERLALQRGAADFVDKSRDMAILAIRLRLAAARSRSLPKGNLGGPLQCGRLTLRPATSRAYWDQVDVGLTLAEYKIVHLLASNVGSFIRYRQIYDCMHHVGFLAGTGEHGYRMNVRSAVRRIREKFKLQCPEFDEIQTYTSFGYCWAMPSTSG